MRKVLYILGQLNDEDVEWMAAEGRRQISNAAGVLIIEGQPSPFLFFVLEGRALVRIRGGAVVAELGAGEVVGEMSFVDSAPPSATVEAEAGCVVLRLEKRRIEDRLKQQPAFAARFYRALAIFLADRLRSTTSRMTSGGGLKADAVMEDELDDSILDNVSLAGVRFERMLSLMSAAPLHEA
jgi:CRP/FNR family cyclic AMP-dependent transcriptional regulator